MSGDNSGRCRNCKAPVFWVLTEKGKRMPLDADPLEPRRPLNVENGNLVICKRGEGGDPDTIRFVKVGTGPYRSHFATCPDRQKPRQRVSR